MFLGQGSYEITGGRPPPLVSDVVPKPLVSEGLKIRVYNQNIVWYATFKPLYLPIHEIIFVKRPNNVLAIFNLCVEQNWVNLDKLCILAKNWLEWP